MTVDTQQFVYRMLALTIPISVILSFIGVTVVAITHDGTAIQMMFDFFKQVITLALPASGVLGVAHLVMSNLPGGVSSAPAAAEAPATPAAAFPAAPQLVPNLDGTAGAV